METSFSEVTQLENIDVNSNLVPQKASSNNLSDLVTKVDKPEGDDDSSSILDLQKVHYNHTLNAVRFIRNQM